ncbi:hypothetical protein C0995_002169 [Termitomyces sp. Mi166|nr:hypothetical protein C0995_002169 [Termitomyces sp. Mi166\
MDAAALLAHILSQTRQNVDFLVAQKQISQDVANEILAKLPKPGVSIDVLAKKTQDLAISTPAPAAHTPTAASPYGQASSAAGATSSPVPAPTLAPGVIFRAKALWDYNEHGANPGDLSFRGGDIIDVIAETNADWWTGRHSGKEGLFPANYVERLVSLPSATPAHTAHPPAPAPTAQAYSPLPTGAPPYGAAPGYSSYTLPAAPGGYGPPPSAYAPQGGYAPPGGYAPTSGYTGPPPPSQAYTPYVSQPGYAPGSSNYHKEHNEGKEHKEHKDKDHDKKKNKMGGLGETLMRPWNCKFATAAVGGVGFGAGTAIGSGIIDSIF